MAYIHEKPRWPDFQWNQAEFAILLAEAHLAEGRLLGRMENLGFELQNEAILETLTLNVLKTSEIEGENLNPTAVRSSVAKQLGLNIAGLIHADRNVEGVVTMTLDATQKYNSSLTEDRLFGWHNCLFPTGRSGLYTIIVANWRDDKQGPMRVVSGVMGKEKVHFQAPPADKIKKEMEQFLNWFNNRNEIDPLIKAAIAHYWFVTIHPFEDGNGRIARAIADMQLARADKTSQRFYSMSAQIQKERSDYYKILEKTSKGNLDITPWLTWFLNCLLRTINNSEKILEKILKKARFWEQHRTDIFNPRQQKIINKLLSDFHGKLTTKIWAKINKCSHDTALRDIQDLTNRGILAQDEAGGRSTSYHLKF